MEQKDFYWLNQKSRDFLARGYLQEGQSAEERIAEIAKAAEKILKKEGFADKFIDYMAKGFYSLSSPIWSNFGLKRGLPISCNGSYIDDTLESILEKQAEVGMQTKNGAGTSAYFGALRGRGATISSGGKSSGSVHFMELFQNVTDVVSQSNVRRGNFAAYLPVEHPDIEEFLEIRENGNAIQNISIGVTITDAWMKSLIDGDKDKRKLWGKIIKKRFESGYPYIFFSDTVNKNKPQVYKDKDLTIYASNLCVTGDTIINLLVNDTDKVSVAIEDLFYYVAKYDNIKVLSRNLESNLNQYNEIVDFGQTGESIDIIEIEDENGNVVKCTPEHKIFTVNRGYVEAQYLKEDDILQSHKN